MTFVCVRSVGGAAVVSSRIIRTRLVIIWLFDLDNGTTTVEADRSR